MAPQSKDYTTFDQESVDVEVVAEKKSTWKYAVVAVAAVVLVTTAVAFSMGNSSEQTPAEVEDWPHYMWNGGGWHCHGRSMSCGRGVNDDFKLGTKLDIISGRHWEATGCIHPDDWLGKDVYIVSQKEGWGGGQKLAVHNDCRWAVRHADRGSMRANGHDSPARTPLLNEGDGDCDRDSDCTGFLKCGRDNCGAQFGRNTRGWRRGSYTSWDTTDDCCYNPLSTSNPAVCMHWNEGPWEWWKMEKRGQGYVFRSGRSHNYYLGMVGFPVFKCCDAYTKKCYQYWKGRGYNFDNARYSPWGEPEAWKYCSSWQNNRGKAKTDPNVGHAQLSTGGWVKQSRYDQKTSQWEIVACEQDPQTVAAKKCPKAKGELTVGLKNIASNKYLKVEDRAILQMQRSFKSGTKMGATFPCSDGTYVIRSPHRNGKTYYTVDTATRAVTNLDGAPTGWTCGACSARRFTCTGPKPSAHISETSYKVSKAFKCDAATSSRPKTALYCSGFQCNTGWWSISIDGKEAYTVNTHNRRVYRAGSNTMTWWSCSRHCGADATFGCSGMNPNSAKNPDTYVITRISADHNRQYVAPVEGTADLLNPAQFKIVTVSAERNGGMIVSPMCRSQGPGGKMVYPIERSHPKQGVCTIQAVCTGTGGSCSATNGKYLSSAFTDKKTFKWETTPGNHKWLLQEENGITTMMSHGGGLGPWKWCAREHSGKPCAFTGTKFVRYGTRGKYKVKKITGTNNAGTACSNGVFGDPIVGWVKDCWVADWESAGEYLQSSMTEGGNAAWSFKKSRTHAWRFKTDFQTGLTEIKTHCTDVDCSAGAKRSKFLHSNSAVGGGFSFGGESTSVKRPGWKRYYECNGGTLVANVGDKYVHISREKCAARCQAHATGNCCQYNQWTGGETRCVVKTASQKKWNHYRNRWTYSFPIAKYAWKVTCEPPKYEGLCTIQSSCTGASGAGTINKYWSSNLHSTVRTSWGGYNNDATKSSAHGYKYSWTLETKYVGDTPVTMIRSHCTANTAGCRATNGKYFQSNMDISSSGWANAKWGTEPNTNFGWVIKEVANGVVQLTRHCKGSSCRSMNYEHMHCNSKENQQMSMGTDHQGAYGWKIHCTKKN